MGRREETHVVDAVVRRLVRAAIEAFPIDGKKKEELLQKILREKKNKEEEAT